MQYQRIGKQFLGQPKYLFVLRITVSYRTDQKCITSKKKSRYFAVVSKKNQLYLAANQYQWSQGILSDCCAQLALRCWLQGENK